MANESRAKPAVVCRNVTKNYGSGDSMVRALRGVDLEVFPGELTLLVGPSGCGKTTLLSVVASILEPTSGEVVVLDRNLVKMSRSAKVRFRRDNIGFVFQQYNLLPALTAAENVTIPLILGGHSRRKSLQTANKLLARMNMSERGGHFPTQLSGGQQQRVAIARALVHHPKLLVCDEPTSALDAKTGHTIMELLRSVAVEGDRAVIIVTHDSRVFEFADCMATMEDGHIIGVERPGESSRAAPLADSGAATAIVPASPLSAPEPADT